MDLKVNKNTLVVFDLDDTLYNEVDYLSSAYLEIASQLSSSSANLIHQEMMNWYYNKFDVFEKLIEKYKASFSKQNLLTIYREHNPSIQLFNDAAVFIENLLLHSISIGIITDGRSITQRNKIKALGLLDKLNHLIISEEIASEKPSELNFKLLMSDTYKNYVYIADNIKKDFISPNNLGWETICLLDKGKNIHKQDFDLPIAYHPKHKIVSFADIKLKYEY